MVQLPEKYCESMKKLLGDEYPEYLQSFAKKSMTAIRINTGKISLDEWKKINPFLTKEVLWTEKGFYYDDQKDFPAKHPYYFAGLYYIQEPSAMIPASILPINEGDHVLDLCAAPGGKATELGAKLHQTGLLVANDISVSRTMALAKNLQMAGISNAMVTAETPEHLLQNFPEFFDKILVDAPCSGEGMFRREPRMIKDWLEKGPEYYSKIQKNILEQAYQMLKPGGKMVYSTCTFSIMEDEEVIQWFLEEHNDMKICEVERKKGFSKGRPDLVENGAEELKHCVRIFPHKTNGEGHFAVLLEKRNTDDFIPNNLMQEFPIDEQFQSLCSELLDMKKNAKSKQGKQKLSKNGYENVKQKNKKKRDNIRKENQSFDFTIEQMEEVRKLIQPFEKKEGKLILKKNQIVVQNMWTESRKSLRIVYTGIPICELKKKVIPSTQLALILKKDDYDNIVDFSVEDERVIRYLKGETISVDKDYNGNVLICVDGYGLGWCQANGQKILKNKYYPGWRYQ